MITFSELIYIYHAPGGLMNIIKSQTFGRTAPPPDEHY